MWRGSSGSCPSGVRLWSDDRFCKRVTYILEACLAPLYGCRSTSDNSFWREDAGGRWSKEREVARQVTTGQLEILQRRKVVKLKDVNKTTLMNK